ncbi:Class III cytochrome C family protein [uncultured archaeon]|nr:Class III cytochrome C family protein [uncultured archaeon]
MKTLLENITFVKGIEYLIVVAFCFGFIALWILVQSREKTIGKVVAAVIPLALLFGGAAIVVASNDTPEATAVPVTGEISPENISVDPFGAGTFRVNDSEYLAIKYGPATEFHKVMSSKVACTKCHHNSGDEVHACRDCHNAPSDPHDSSKPGLKAAYHQLCISCHKEDFGGPESCTKCHTGETKDSIIQAPARPHELTWETCNRCHKDGIPNGGKEAKIVYHDSCLKCHSNGVAGAAKVPADHAGRSATTCQGCHKAAGG